MNESWLVFSKSYASLFEIFFFLCCFRCEPIRCPGNDESQSVSGYQPFCCPATGRPTHPNESDSHIDYCFCTGHLGWPITHPSPAKRSTNVHCRNSSFLLPSRLQPIPLGGASLVHVTLNPRLVGSGEYGCGSYGGPWRNFRVGKCIFSLSRWRSGKLFYDTAEGNGGIRGGRMKLWYMRENLQLRTTLRNWGIEIEKTEGWRKLVCGKWWLRLWASCRRSKRHGKLWIEGLRSKLGCHKKGEWRESECVIYRNWFVYYWQQSLWYQLEQAWSMMLSMLPGWCRWLLMQVLIDTLVRWISCLCSPLFLWLLPVKHARQEIIYTLLPSSF